MLCKTTSSQIGRKKMCTREHTEHTSTLSASGFVYARISKNKQRSVTVMTDSGSAGIKWSYRTQMKLCVIQRMFFQPVLLKVKSQDSLFALSRQLTKSDAFGTPKSVCLHFMRDKDSNFTDIIKKSLAQPQDCHRSFLDFAVTVRKNVKR